MSLVSMLHWQVCFSSWKCSNIVEVKNSEIVVNNLPWVAVQTRPFTLQISPWALNDYLKWMLLLGAPECCCRRASERAIFVHLALPPPFVWSPSRWPGTPAWLQRGPHLSEAVIASWLRDIWLNCSATDYYYPFLREQFPSHSEKTKRASVKLKRIARRINSLAREVRRDKLR